MWCSNGRLSVTTMKQKRTMNKVSPTGLSTTALVANQVSILATFSERLNRPFCVNSTVQPQATLTYRYETPYLNGTTVFVPIVVTISIIAPTCGRNGNAMRAQPMIYSERMVAAFQGQTALPTAVTITSVGRMQKANDVVCGKARVLDIYDSLTIALTTA